MAGQLATVEARIQSPDARDALRVLLAAAARAGFRFVYRLNAVLSVELTDGRRNYFSAQAATGHVNFYIRSPSLTRTPGLMKRAVERYGAIKPNSRGEYRVRVRDAAEATELLDWLAATGAWPELAAVWRRRSRNGRLHAGEFAAVTPDHLYRAALAVLAGEAHGFSASRDYDMIFDGVRLPPKAVFGLAASMALGETIGPGDFSGGLGTPCFRAITAAGYLIVEKHAPLPKAEPLNTTDRLWAEGDKRLVEHLKRERGDGLAAAKRADFLKLHGKLFCERCLLDPVEHYSGEDGVACIEVHHARVAIADMSPGHRTSLDDLQCLCANCHRVVHRELKRANCAASEAAVRS